MTNPIRDYWLEHKDKDFCICPALKCADGFSMSVQASRMHYCHPRENLEDGDYSHWEVGFPSEAEPLLAPHGSTLLSEQFYEYVPTQTINEIIAKHGGIVGTAPMKRGCRKRSA